jgi:nitrite reductase/ring-hydroxylating ferredoxin subunit
VSDLAVGEMIVVEVGDERLLLVNVEGKVYACEDICSHAFASLAEGDLNGLEVECPLHGSAFNVTTGDAITPRFGLSSQPRDSGDRLGLG